MRSVIVFIFLFSTLALSAQSKAPAPFQRKGFLIGGALGGSSIQLSANNADNETQTGLSFPNFKIGTMIAPRMALLLYLPGTVYRYSQEGRKRDRGFEGIIPSVQYWAGNRCWLLGGLGLGMDAPAFYDIKVPAERKFYFGTAALAGAGYELWRKRNMTLDLQGRVHYGRIQWPGNRYTGVAFSLLLGFNFY